MRRFPGFRQRIAWLGISIFLCTACGNRVLRASEEKESDSKKGTTQNVGGLLFDVDEGVKVEQGPGGSVYVKSNREYMQGKFDEIDQKIADFEKRIALLESDPKKPGTNSSDSEKQEGRQVLVS